LHGAGSLGYRWGMTQTPFDPDESKNVSPADQKERLEREPEEQQNREDTSDPDRREPRKG